MFTKVFSTRLKILFRDRETLFWTLAFPMILAVFFYMGLSGLRSANDFDPIAIAAVNDAAWQAEENQAFRETVQEIAAAQDPLFTLVEVDQTEAEQLLQAGEITVILEKHDSIEMNVLQSSFGASIIHSFLNQYEQNSATVSRLIQSDPSQAAAIIESLNDRGQYVVDRPISSNEIDPLLNFFYALIGMSCFYGSMLGMREVSEIQANQSEVAARVNVSPAPKMRYFLSSSLASLLVHFAQMILLLLFMRFVLDISFGDQAAYVVLTCLLGSLAGFAFGSFISAAVRVGENAKVGILIASTMIMSFLSGMMFADMKHIVRQHAPLLAYLNPVSLITDSLFSLNYFETYTRYGINMLILACFAIVFMGLTYLLIRRPRYASI